MFEAPCGYSAWSPKLIFPSRSRNRPQGIPTLIIQSLCKSGQIRNIGRIENKYLNHAIHWFAAGAPPWGAPSLACANRVASELPILRDLHTIST